jgi:hypothetical protein
MSQSAWINLNLAGPGGRHSVAQSGDLQSGDATFSYDPVKAAATSVESILSALRIQLLGRGLR